MNPRAKRRLSAMSRQKYLEFRVFRSLLNRLPAGLGIATTAEGVEAPARLEQLAANGCPEVQRFLFGLPQPAGEALRLLSDWSPVLHGQQLIVKEADPGGARWGAEDGTAWSEHSPPFSPVC